MADSRAADDGGASVDDDGGDCHNGGGIEHFLSLNCNPSVDKLDFLEIIIFTVCIFFFSQYHS